jgi:hypothetical protein
MITLMTQDLINVMRITREIYMVGSAAILNLEWYLLLKSERECPIRYS